MLSSWKGLPHTGKRPRLRGLVRRRWGAEPGVKPGRCGRQPHRPLPGRGRCVQHPLGRRCTHLPQVGHVSDDLGKVERLQPQTSEGARAPCARVPRYRLARCVWHASLARQHVRARAFASNFAVCPTCVQARRWHLSGHYYLSKVDPADGSGADDQVSLLDSLACASLVVCALRVGAGAHVSILRRQLHRCTLARYECQ